MELSKVVTALITILVIGLVIGIGVYIASDIEDETAVKTSESSVQFILSDNATANTLTPVGEGISSSSATVKNQTWLEFDGVNDFVEINNQAWITQKSNFSWSGWINVSNLDSGIAKLWFMSGWISVQTNKALYGGRILYEFRNQTTPNYYINITSQTEINDSNWHHVVVTMKNNGSDFMNQSLYINGILENSSFNHANAGTSYSKYIIGTTSLSWKGSVDEVRWYNKSLTDNQIQEIYSSGRFPNSSLFSEGLLNWLPLNENSGTDVHSLNQSDFT